MKIQHLSVIFVIIIIPIILMLSYYISLQLDTVNMQTAYTSKQLNATKEAIEAFEINTVEWNEAYSENADSKRRDVMASINTFTTSFANSLGIGGANKESILGYVPAIACTLYDGYYIYTPAEVKEVIKDEKGVAVFWTETLWNSGKVTATFPESDYEEYKGKLLYKCMADEGPDGTYNGEAFTFDSTKAVSTYEHILKPFSTYSARYKKGDTDITVNYTLDNYVTIYGTVNGEYVVKSGYLILPREDLEIESENLSERIAWRWNEDDSYKCGAYSYVYAEDNTKVYIDVNTTFQVSNSGVRTDLNKTTEIKYKKVRENSWDVVYQALNTGTIKQKNSEGEIVPITIEQGKLYRDKKGTLAENLQENIEIRKDYSVRNYYIESRDFTEWVKQNLSDITIGDMQVPDSEKSKYGNSTDKIFDISTDPESENSVINLHKREVIKQTLISNLNQAITSYSRNSEGEYSLPILTETDWDHVLRNVSIITFVQNVPIGMKYYNNYAIATSTENKEYTNPDEIYLTRIGDNYYHLPYCEHLSSNTSIIGYRNIDYVVKSYEDNYYYKHSNIANEACYYCLVQRDLYSSEGLSNQEWKAHDKAYKIALARERYRNISEVNLREKLDSYHTVTFNQNYEGAPILERKYADYQYYGALPEPTRAGYSLIGWYKEQECVTPVTSNMEVISNHTLYARWEVKPITVTLDASNGDVSAMTVTYGNAYGSLPTPIREGYRFNGWFTDPTGGTRVTEETIVTRDENHTLYAQWTLNRYTVRFDANGGTVLATSKQVIKGETYGALPTPTRTGFTFVGWFTVKRGGTQITPNTIVTIATNHTIYAQWTANPTVTFNANGGTVSPESIQVINGGTYGTLPTPTRTGYTFVGWFTDSATRDTSKAYKDYPWLYYADRYDDLYNAFGYNQNSLRNHYNTYGLSEGRRTSQYISTDTVEITSDITLYAGWTPNTYTVTFNANGGSGAPSAQTKTYGVNLTLSTKTPTRSGYIFKGWATSSNGSSSYQPGGTFTTNANTTLYAVWQQVINVSSVTLNKTGDQWIPKTGGSLSLTATVSPSNATNKTVTWSSSNSGVASVSGGTVTARGPGKATITATAGTKSASVNVYVYNAVLKYSSGAYYTRDQYGNNTGAIEPYSGGAKLVLEYKGSSLWYMHYITNGKRQYGSGDYLQASSTLNSNFTNYGAY